MDRSGSSLVFWCLIVLSVGLILLSIFNFTKKKLEYKKVIRTREEYIQKTAFSARDKKLLLELSTRTYVLYYSYLIHKIMAILCNIYSLMYTIVSFAFSFGSSDLRSYFVSFMAFFFVAVTVYLAPQKHSVQYLIAWRSLNNQLLSNLYDIGYEGEGMLNAKEIIHFMKTVEDRLTVDED